MKRRTQMKFSKTLALAGLLAGSLILPGPMATAEAHGNGNGNGNGKSKHNFCYDKHGRWRSHPHCPPPQHSHYRGYHHDYDRYPSHTHYHRSAPAPYQRRAELRRDIRNKVGKDEIARDRQEIRADLDKIKSTRSDLRKDQLAGARR